MTICVFSVLRVFALIKLKSVSWKILSFCFLHEYVLCSHYVMRKVTLKSFKYCAKLDGRTKGKRRHK